MADKPRVKIGSHWKRPSTRVYDYNYNLGEHYYKPQLRHLDQKQAGRTTEPPPGAKTFAERLAEDPLCCGLAGKGHRSSCDHGHAPTRPTVDFDLPRRRRGSLDDLLADSPAGWRNGDNNGAGAGRSRPHKLDIPSLTDKILDSVGIKTPDGFLDDALDGLRKRRPRTANVDDLLNDPFFAKGTGNARAELDALIRDDPLKTAADFRTEMDKADRGRRNRLRELNEELDNMNASSKTVGRKGASDISALNSLSSLDESSSVSIKKRSVKATISSETVRY